jgi:hypothetical protein
VILLSHIRKLGPGRFSKAAIFLSTVMKTSCSISSESIADRPCFRHWDRTSGPYRYDRCTQLSASPCLARSIRLSDVVRPSAFRTAPLLLSGSFTIFPLSPGGGRSGSVPADRCAPPDLSRHRNSKRPAEPYPPATRQQPAGPQGGERLIGLPFHHKHPFDRLLVAQALAEQLPIASADLQLDARNITRSSGDESRL